MECHKSLYRSCEVKKEFIITMQQNSEVIANKIILPPTLYITAKNHPLPASCRQAANILVRQCYIIARALFRGVRELSISTT